MKIKETVHSILVMLGLKQIPYAVLRNYENLPEIGNDLDIIINLDSIYEIIPLLNDIAKDLGWSYLTSSNHFVSHLKYASIVIFKFYDLKNHENFLQVDFFGGMSLLSCKLFDSNEILRARVKYYDYFVISYQHELAMRLMQLSKANCNNRKSKIRHVTRKLLKSSSTESNLAFLKRTFKSNLIVNLLHQINSIQFKKVCFRLKLFFLLKTLTRNPIEGLLSFIIRLKDYFNLFFLKQPGIDMLIDPVYTTEERKCLIDNCNFLIKNKIIRDYCFSSSLLDFNRLKIKERGGICFYLSHKGINLSLITTDYLIKKLASHNIVIFKNNQH